MLGRFAAHQKPSGIVSQSVSTSGLAMKNMVKRLEDTYMHLVMILTPPPPLRTMANAVWTSPHPLPNCFRNLHRPRSPVPSLELGLGTPSGSSDDSGSDSDSDSDIHLDSNQEDRGGEEQQEVCRYAPEEQRKRKRMRRDAVKRRLQRLRRQRLSSSPALPFEGYIPTR
jgi:hypothetical protein